MTKKNGLVSHCTQSHSPTVPFSRRGLALRGGLLACACSRITPAGFESRRDREFSAQCPVSYPTGIKRPGCEAHHSSSSTAEAMKTSPAQTWLQLQTARTYIHAYIDVTYDLFVRRDLAISGGVVVAAVLWEGGSVPNWTYGPVTPLTHLSRWTQQSPRRPLFRRTRPADMGLCTG